MGLAGVCAVDGQGIGAFVLQMAAERMGQASHHHADAWSPALQRADKGLWGWLVFVLLMDKGWCVCAADGGGAYGSGIPPPC